FIGEAYYEALSRLTHLRHGKNSLLILNSFRPIPCAWYQWTSASCVLPSGNRIVATPFILRQRGRRSTSSSGWRRGEVGHPGFSSPRAAAPDGRPSSQPTGATLH